VHSDLLHSLPYGCLARHAICLAERSFQISPRHPWGGPDSAKRFSVRVDRERSGPRPNGGILGPGGRPSFSVFKEPECACLAAARPDGESGFPEDRKTPSSILPRCAGEDAAALACESAGESLIAAVVERRRLGSPCDEALQGQAGSPRAEPGRRKLTSGCHRLTLACRKSRAGRCSWR
jgi:hypothetical protein